MINRRFISSKPMYTVTFSNPANGTVTAKRLDTGETITSGTKVPAGTEVQFTCTPASGYSFSSWTY